MLTLEKVALASSDFKRHFAHAQRSFGGNGASRVKWVGT